MLQPLLLGTNDGLGGVDIRNDDVRPPAQLGGVLDRKTAEGVVKTAKTVARLYALQLEEVDNV